MSTQADQTATQTMDPEAVLQRKLKRAGAICKILRKAVIDKFGADGVSEEMDGVFKSFTRVWEIMDSDGNPSQATVSCAVVASGSLEVTLTKNIAERLNAKATDNASDDTPAVLLQIPLSHIVEQSPNVMIVRVKNPPLAPTMCGYWKVKESLDPEDLNVSPHHTYPALLAMVYGLCSV